METDAYLLTCGRYVERNPLVARLVETPWHYRWSSCRAYALGEPDVLLSYNPWYEQLAATADARQVHWRTFLLGADDKEAVVQRHDWVVGEPAFRQRMQWREARPAPRGAGRPCGSRSAAASAQGTLFPM